MLLERSDDWCVERFIFYEQEDVAIASSTEARASIRQ